MVTIMQQELHSPGAILAGRYRVIRRIGKGGMGQLYLAEDRRNGAAWVAVKESTDPRPDAASRLIDEVGFLERLRNPGLPRYIDRFAAQDGRVYVVMEFVPGRNLSEIRSSQPVGETQSIRWVVRICEILTYLHTWTDPRTDRNCPIVHQDIKPANVIIRAPRGTLVLVDLGIACYSHHRSKGMSEGYSPPEQCCDDGLVEPRSDIFSTGATLLYLLTGEDPPSVERNDWSKELHRLIVNTSAKPRLRAVVQQAMQPAIEARYLTAEHMRTALLEC